MTHQDNSTSLTRARSSRRPNDGSRTKRPRAVDEGMSAGCHAFEKRDFYRACFLRCAGYDLIALRREGRRKIDRPTRRDAVLAFYGAAAAVPALVFATTIKDMKALLHNA
jgi:hypothetical protein